MQQFLPVTIAAFCLSSTCWANLLSRFFPRVADSVLSSDGVLEDMSLASRILEDNFYSPWPWPWPRGLCPWPWPWPRG